MYVASLRYSWVKMNNKFSNVFSCILNLVNSTSKQLISTYVKWFIFLLGKSGCIVTYCDLKNTRTESLLMNCRTCDCDVGLIYTVLWHVWVTGRVSGWGNAQLSQKNHATFPLIWISLRSLILVCMTVACDNVWKLSYLTEAVTVGIVFTTWHYQPRHCLFRAVRSPCSSISSFVFIRSDRLSVHSFVRWSRQILLHCTMISHEWLEQSRWNLQGIFISPDWWPD